MNNLTDKNKDSGGKIDLNNLTKSFFRFCSAGDLESIKKILSKNSVKELDCENKGLKYAAMYGNLNIIKYLLTSDELSTHSTLLYEKDTICALGYACEYNQLEIVKYLLTSSELKKPSNVHHIDDYPFITSVVRGNLDVIKYLIFDYKIKQTKIIYEFLKYQEDLYLNDIKSNVLAMFESRALNNSIDVVDCKKDISKKKL